MSHFKISDRSVTRLRIDYERVKSALALAEREVEALKVQRSALISAAIVEGCAPLWKDGVKVSPPVWFLGLTSYRTKEEAVRALLERAGISTEAAETP